MGKYAAVLMALALIAAAFFLPAQLSQWQDGRLLDEPHVSRQEEAREGFAESTQLSVPEKLLLLRGGTLTSMDLGGEAVRGLFVIARNSAGEMERSVEYMEFLPSAAADVEMTERSAELEGAAGYTTEEADEIQARWSQRLDDAWMELRALQSMGGLPELWGATAELEYAAIGEALYVDPDTGMRFRVYNISFSCHPYSMAMTVDEQTGRILSFSLNWEKGAPVNWGIQGTGKFGSAWRDYWSLDSVNNGWYSDYVREILEIPEEAFRNNGAYNCNGQIVFSYDGQNLPIDLCNWVYNAREGYILWN